MTLRARPGVPSLRGDRVFGAVRAALARASRETFRVVHFSVQRDHVHLLVEADRRGALSRGIQGLAIRVARAVNRVLGRRGSFWADRHYARMLPTPREVRNALVYVLQNWRKHERDARGLDPRSSAWFTGWRVAVTEAGTPSPVAQARTWLGRIGWRRHGPVGIEEAPRRHPRAVGRRPSGSSRPR